MADLPIIINLFSVAILTVLLATTLYKFQRDDRQTGLQLNMFIVAIVMLGSEIGLYLLRGRIQGIRSAGALLFALRCLMVMAFYSLCILIVTYTVYHISLRHPVSAWFERFTILVCLISVIAWFRAPVPWAQPGGLPERAVFWSGRIGAYLTGLCVLFLVFYYRKYLEKADCAALLSVLVFPCAAEILYLKSRNIWLMGSAVTLTLLLVYGLIFVRRRKLLEIRAIALSQVKPHFTFNILNSIYVLIEKDPNEARRVVEEFSDYLRGNLDGMEKKGVVPFFKEKEYVMHYLNLEKIRFQEKLRVEWDLETEDFSLPLLTVQPLVDNAIRHGIMRKKNGGTVLIRTRDLGKDVEITVKDDGVGFDPDNIPSDERAHIGIENVRERIEKQCGGTLTIESERGKGTTVTIRIPEAGMKK